MYTKSILKIMNEEYDAAVIEQFCYVQDKLDNTVSDFIVNIFTLYDINGNGELDFHHFALFIGDLLYISVLMKRLKKEEYNQEVILKYARWAGGNFPTNLFTGTINTITYYIFTKGILYALNEYEHNPFPGNTTCTRVSLLSEFMSYFNFYNDIAIRRGWTLRRQSHVNHSSRQHTQAAAPPPNTIVIEGSLHVTGDMIIGGDTHL